MELNSDESLAPLPLLDRLGGRVFLKVAAENFCDRIFSDPRLRDLVNGIERARLRDLVITFATSLFKVDSVSQSQFAESFSEEFRLSRAQFDDAVSHIIAALIWTGIDRKLIEEILDRIIPFETCLVESANSRSEDGP